MADFLVIKIDKNDGSGAAPSFISDITDNNLQLTDTPSEAIVLKWDTSAITEVEGGELAEAFHSAKEIAEVMTNLNQSRIYVDIITIP